ncbi:MAG: methyltransferase domain-containing protein [Acidobacteria bacterium]|nr:methyltransferase domain-containing protein [Acidobacteriota bacterium]
MALYPVEGLCIASDRWNTPDRTPPALPEDIVYPALVSTTRKFLAGMPRLPCGAFLELCAGTGIAALLAARDFARHAWAFDIAPRSVHFAEFNARLNGIGNITTGAGDLFDPAGDLTFDCIVAHPPYVPVRERKWIYMDGGEDGEEITRRIIQALPRYLRPDGRFYVRALAAERKHARYEDRVREWLAAAAPEFDLALIISKTLKPDEYAMLAAVKSVSPLQEMRGWHDVFDKLEITGLHQGITVLRRFRAPRPPFTVRRMAGPESGPGEIEWLLGWEAAAADGSALAAVLASELCADTRTELRIESRLRAGEWTPTEYVLAAGYPFQMELRAQAWIPHLLALCAGRGRTGHELLDHLRQEGIVHPETRPEEFADALLPLISGGFLRFAATSNVSG